MHYIGRFCIAHVGLNTNGVRFTEEAFKLCVENTKNETLPITNCFFKNDVVGYMTNFEYKDGKIFADCFSDVNVEFDEVIRCAFMTDGMFKLENQIIVDKCKLIEGAIVKQKDDAERFLTRGE